MPPPALNGELVRTRLLEVVDQRFRVPLTVIVAGAGFGKSTLLAQAIRSNHADPRGIDAWLSCEPADCDAEYLASAIVACLGDPGDRGEPVERVLAAIDRLAPIDVCVVMDDVHELPPRSTAADLLGELVARLPPHAHLVVAARTDPPIPPSARRECRTRSRGPRVHSDRGRRPRQVGWAATPAATSDGASPDGRRSCVSPSRHLKARRRSSCGRRSSPA